MPDLTISIKGVDEFSKVADEVTRNFGGMLTVLNRKLQVMSNRAQKAAQDLRGLAASANTTATALEKGSQSLSSFASLAAEAGQMGATAFDRMSKAVSRAFSDMGSLAEQGLSKIGTSISKIGGGGLSQNFLSPLLESIRGATQEVIRGVTQMVKGAIGGVTSFVAEAYRMVGDFIKGSGTIGGAVIGTLIAPGPGTLIGGGIGAFAGGFLKAFPEMMAGAVEAAGSILKGLVGVAGGVFEGVVNIGFQVLSGLVTVVQGIVERVAGAFSSLVDKVGGILGDVAGKVSTVFVGMTSFAGYQAAQMEASLATAFGLIPDAGEKAFKEMRDGVTKLLADTPFLSGHQLARGLFQAISSGAREPAQAMALVKNAAEAAVGGGVKELEEVVRSLTRTTLLYNSEAKETVDLLFQTQNLGQLTFGELSRGIGLVSGMAKAAGLDLKDMLKSVALGSRILDPESLFTGIRRAIQTLFAPTPDAATARESLGLRFKEMTDAEEKEYKTRLDHLNTLKAAERILERLPARSPKQALALKDLREEVAKGSEEFERFAKATGTPVGLSKAIEMLRDAKLSFEEFRSVVPEIRAMTFLAGAAALGKEQKDQIDRLIEDSKDAAKKAFDMRANTLMGAVSMTWHGFVALISKAEERMKDDLVAGVRRVHKAFQEFSESPAFDRIVAWVHKMANAMFENLGKAIEWLKVNWTDVERRMVEGWGHVETVMIAAWEGAKAGYIAIRDFVEGGTMDRWIGYWNEVKRVAGDVWAIIEAMAEGDMKPLTDALTGIWDVFTARAEWAWERVKEFALSTTADVLEFMGRGLQEALSRVPGLAKFMGAPENPKGVDDAIKAARAARTIRGIGIPEGATPDQLWNARRNWPIASDKQKEGMAEKWGLSVEKLYKLLVAWEDLREAAGGVFPKGDPNRFVRNAERDAERTLAENNLLKPTADRLREMAKEAGESASRIKEETEARENMIRALREEARERREDAPRRRKEREAAASGEDPLRPTPVAPEAGKSVPEAKATADQVAQSFEAWLQKKSDQERAEMKERADAAADRAARSPESQRGEAEQKVRDAMAALADKEQAIADEIERLTKMATRPLTDEEAQNVANRVIQKLETAVEVARAGASPDKVWGWKKKATAPEGAGPAAGETPEERERRVRENAKRLLIETGLLSAEDAVPKSRGGRSSGPGGRGSRRREDVEDRLQRRAFGGDTRNIGSSFGDLNSRQGGLAYTAMQERINEAINRLSKEQYEIFRQIQDDAKKHGMRMTAGNIKALLKASKSGTVEKARESLAEQIDTYLKENQDLGEREVERLKLVQKALEEMGEAQKEAAVDQDALLEAIVHKMKEMETIETDKAKSAKEKLKQLNAAGG